MKFYCHRHTYNHNFSVCIKMRSLLLTSRARSKYFASAIIIITVTIAVGVVKVYLLCYEPPPTLCLTLIQWEREKNWRQLNIQTYYIPVWATKTLVKIFNFQKHARFFLCTINRMVFFCRGTLMVTLAGWWLHRLASCQQVRKIKQRQAAFILHIHTYVYVQWRWKWTEHCLCACISI